MCVCVCVCVVRGSIGGVLSREVWGERGGEVKRGERGENEGKEERRVEEREEESNVGTRGKGGGG